MCAHTLPVILKKWENTPNGVSLLDGAKWGHIVNGDYRLILKSLNKFWKNSFEVEGVIMISCFGLRIGVDQRK